MGIVVIGAVFVDIKGFPLDAYIPTGRNAGHIKYIHGGVSRNVVEDTANIETMYRSDITGVCRIARAEDKAVFDIINEPEDINQRHQFLKFKVKRLKGGA